MTAENDEFNFFARIQNQKASVGQSLELNVVQVIFYYAKH